MPPLCVVLTIPVVTVFCRENGLPMATTNSPGRRSAERPSNSTGSFICTHKGEQDKRENIGDEFRSNGLIKQALELRSSSDSMHSLID